MALRTTAGLLTLVAGLALLAGPLRMMVKKSQADAQMPASAEPIKQTPAAPGPPPTTWQEWEQVQNDRNPNERTYEFNGDRLGMPLDFFKAKYHRVSKSGDILPMTSEKNPDKDDNVLLYQASHHKLGIVNAVIALPSEAKQQPEVMPTIADARTERYVYLFVDGELFQIAVFFHHEDFDHVLHYLKAEFGKPAADQIYEPHIPGRKGTLEMVTWETGSSEAVLNEIETTSGLAGLHVYKRDLTAKALDRMK